MIRCRKCPPLKFCGWLIATTFTIYTFKFVAILQIWVKNDVSTINITLSFKFYGLLFKGNHIQTDYISIEFKQIYTLNDTVSQLNSQQEVSDNLGVCSLNLLIVWEKNWNRKNWWLKSHVNLMVEVSCSKSPLWQVRWQ